MSKEFEAHIQPGNEVIWSDSLQYRVNKSRLRRLAKPAKISEKLKELIEKRKHEQEKSKTQGET